MTVLSRKIGMTSYICLVAQMMPKRTVYLERTPQDIHFLISSNRVLLGKLKSRNKMIKVRPQIFNEDLTSSQRNGAGSGRAIRNKYLVKTKQ